MLGKSNIFRVRLAGAAALSFVVLSTGCAPTYSPDTYASNAVQLANKVDQGVIVGIRAVMISADPTIGTATLGAAGGIAGSQVGAGATSALGALGGTVAGGLVGNVVSHTGGDTTGFEYIVRKPNGDLLSVTQKDVAPLDIGLHVLIIQGPQARIVPDYTVSVEEPAPHAAAKQDSAKPDKPHGAETPVQTVPPAQVLVTPPVTAEILPPPPKAAPDNAPAPDAQKPPATPSEPKSGDNAVGTIPEGI